MPVLNKWAGDTFPLGAWSDDYDPAVDVARLIAAKSTSITINRNGASLSAQTVRIETDRGDTQVQTAGGVTRQANVRVLGYKDHPTITDTDIQAGDRFKVDDVNYEVLMLAPKTPGSVQAYCMVRA